MDDLERLRAIIEFQAEVANARLHLDEVMPLVAERAQHLTGAGAAVIELVEGDEMVYTAATGTAREHLGMRLSRATSLSGLCVALNEVLNCEDSETDERVDSKAVRAVGARSMVCVPLIHDDTPVGVLKVMSPEPRRFADSDIDTLRSLSSVVAAQMSHASDFQRATHESRHDALTEISNRRAYDERLVTEVSRSVRYGQPLSLLILDVDRFKSVNDQLGHAAGDAVLRAVAAALLSTVRVADDVFRIGGDEFAVLLPATRIESARLVAGRIADAVRALRLGDGSVGVSVGAAELEGAVPAELHAAADSALYEVKAGRAIG